MRYGEFGPIEEMDIVGVHLLDSRKIANEQVSEFILGTSVVLVTEKDFFLDALLFVSPSTVSARAQFLESNISTLSFPSFQVFPLAFFILICVLPGRSIIYLPRHVLRLEIRVRRERWCCSKRATPWSHQSFTSNSPHTVILH